MLVIKKSWFFLLYSQSKVKVIKKFIIAQKYKMKQSNI